MVVLRGECQPFDITGTQADECLTGFEFQINLVTHVTAQPVHLVSAVEQRAHAAIAVQCGAARRRGVEAQPESADQNCGTLHGEVFAAVVADSVSPSTSGSDPNSMILNPSG